MAVLWHVFCLLVHRREACSLTLGITITSARSVTVGIWRGKLQSHDDRDQNKFDCNHGSTCVTVPCSLLGPKRLGRVFCPFLRRQPSVEWATFASFIAVASIPSNLVLPVSFVCYFWSSPVAIPLIPHYSNFSAPSCVFIVSLREIYRDKNGTIFSLMLGCFPFRTLWYIYVFMYSIYSTCLHISGLSHMCFFSTHMITCDHFDNL